MALKAAALKTMRPGRHPDGRYGLYFNVAGNSRTWVQRLTVDGRRRNFGLGPWPVVRLAEARETAFENVRKRQRGIRLVTGRRRARTVPTFEQAADAYIALQAPGWKAGSRNASNWRSSLAHAAAIAERPVDAITTDDVLAVVTGLLRAGKAPTARSVRQRIRAVLDWAGASGHRTGPNPANGELDAVVPRSGHRIAHHASVPASEVADVLAAAAAIETPTWRGMTGALRFAVLTAARTSEVLGARWGEVDLDAATWTVPAARMKANVEHRVPLSTAALDVLGEARGRTGGGGLVFRAPRGGKLDTAALRRVMRRIGAGATVHGFRGAFKSWCLESGIARELAEMSLAHQFMGDTERSYVRTDLLERRRPVMERWGRFCTGRPGGGESLMSRHGAP